MFHHEFDSGVYYLVGEFSEVRICIPFRRNEEGVYVWQPPRISTTAIYEDMTPDEFSNHVDNLMILRALVKNAPLTIERMIGGECTHSSTARGNVIRAATLLNGLWSANLELMFE